MLRGRIVKVRDVPAASIEVAPDARWALRGDRGLTYADAPPAGSRLVDGDWWPAGYDGPPLVSFAEDIGAALELRRGDAVTVNVLGREVTATVANFRAVDWRSLGINFVMVFSANALKGAPHVNLMTVRVDPAREEGLLNRISAAFPTVTAVRVRDALDQVNAFLSDVLLGLRAANGLSLLTGLLVMAGAWTAGLEARAYEAAVLKCCGATRRQVFAIYALEFLAIALATAAVATAIGTAIAWAIATYYLRIGFAFSSAAALVVALLAIAMCLGAGLLTASRAFAARAPALLRGE
jgi:putative ABC transport system permease protein